MHRLYASTMTLYMKYLSILRFWHLEQIPSRENTKRVLDTGVSTECLAANKTKRRLKLSLKLPFL